MTATKVIVSANSTGLNSGVVQDKNKDFKKYSAENLIITTGSGYE